MKAPMISIAEDAINDCEHSMHYPVKYWFFQEGFISPKWTEK